MKVRFFVAGCLVALMALFLAVPAALAADVSIGGGVGFAPDYEGSDDYELVPIPAFDARFNNGMYIKLLGLNLRANLLPSDFWRLGPVYNYRPERDDVDNNAVDNLKDVDDAHELGIFGGMEWQGWFVFLELLGDTSDSHDGWYSTLKGGYNWKISNEWMLSIGGHTTYADDDYMQTYFSVTPADSARSGLAVYDADEGFKDVGLDLGVRWNFASNLGLQGLLSISQLVGDADDDSPITDQGDETQIFGGVLLIYNF